MIILTDIAGMNQGEEKSPLLVIDRIVSTFYRMPKNIGIKVIREGIILNPRKAIRKEFEIQKGLYNNGIHVPRPLGIGEIELEGGVSEGLFMEYINGKMLLELSEEDGKEVLLRARVEIEKSRMLGFVPGYDCEYEGNIIRSDKDGKIYLIDFGNWIYPS